MQSITLQTYELKDLIREAVSEALYLDIRAVSDDELSVDTLNTCQKADQREFADGKASSFDKVYKKCMK